MSRQETLRFPSRVRAAETRVASMTKTSSMSADVIRRILNMPEDLSGLNLVDLAAGASSFVPWLLDQGVNAYAVDCVYDRTLDEILAKVRSYTSSTLNQEPEKHRRFLEQEAEKAMADFSQSFGELRDRYIAAWLSELPIEDNFADITTSVQGLGTILYLEFLLIEPLIEEALRITKPGGRILLSPVDMKTKGDRAIFNRLNRRPDLSVSIRTQTDRSLVYFPVLELVKKS